MEEEKSKYDTSSILLITFVVVTLITNISIAAGQNFANWYKKPTLVFILMGLSIIRNVNYFLPAFAIKNKTLKIAGIILTAIMVLYLITSTILKTLEINF